MDIPPPPAELIFVGRPKNWDDVGREFVGYLTRFCGLQPEHSVLDIGCGIGRIASPLTNYLAGQYEGFDVASIGIDWCREEISSRYPTFHFTHADIHNSRYNPNGLVEAEKFRFPYGDRVFDVAFATSVFTHMLPLGVERYLTECRRVLRGRALFTFYLWNAEARALLEGSPEGRPTFRHDFGSYRVERVDRPEHVVAYAEASVLSMLESAGLRVEAIHYGRWCGRSDWLSWQDVVIAS